MPVSHLTESIAYQPGTTARTGAPCSRVQRRTVHVECQDRVRMQRLGQRKRPGERVHAGRRPGTAHDRRRAGRPRPRRHVRRRGPGRRPATGPPQSAWLSAPRPHCTPPIGGVNSVRRWPAHSSSTAVRGGRQCAKIVERQLVRRSTAPLTGSRHPSRRHPRVRRSGCDGSGPLSTSRRRAAPGARPAGSPAPPRWLPCST